MDLVLLLHPALKEHVEKFSQFVKDMTDKGGAALGALLNFFATEIGTVSALTLIFVGIWMTVHYAGVSVITNLADKIVTAALAAGTWARRNGGNAK